MNLRPQPYLVKLKNLFTVLSCTLIALSGQYATAQSTDDIRWKSEQQIKQRYGNPQRIRGPVGTHARYTVWEYPEFSIAFSNSRAFHLFKKDSLKKIIYTQG